MSAVSLDPLIVAVSLNPALDLTYTVPELVPQTSHRVTEVVARAGGKGINVARVLHRLGARTRVLGLLGGATGERIEAELIGAGVSARFTRFAGETRRTVTVVDPAGATVLNEPGPYVGATVWAAFRETFAEVLPQAGVVVLSGSRPPGVPETAYADLVAIASAAGVPTVLDTEGPALHLALRSGPSVAKPNADEAAGLLGRPVRSRGDAAQAAHRLVELGARAGIVSRGADGLVAVTGGSVHHVAVPRRVTGNPTGAGDALAAVLAHGLATHAPWAEVLAKGAAVAAAAVASPWAGDFDDTVAAELVTAATVEIQHLDRKQGTCPTSPPR